MKIDFHHHIFPKPYVDAFAGSDGYPRFQIETDGRLMYVRKQDSVPLPRSVYDTDYRIRDLDRYGIDIAVLSLPLPFVDLFPLGKAVAVARAVNDHIAQEVEGHPDRLVGLAALPMNSVDAAIEEAKRAIKDLGMKGFCLPTSINGNPPVSDEYLPLYETLASLGGVLFFHPNNPAGASAMASRRLITLLGYLFDTTLLVAKLVYEGVLERLPNLRVVTSHLGGALPYLAGRLHRGYLDYAECKENITRSPTHYLRNLYTDSISFDRDAMLFAHRFFGEDRILYGTDYPFLLGTPQTIAEDVKALGLHEEAEAKVFYKNAMRLLGLSK